MCYKLFTQLGYGELAKKRFGPKLTGSGLRERPTIWDTLFISATIEASNFKFCTLWFGE